MKNLFDFFFEFYNQMTLGSNKTLIFSAFTKNESKKRKSDEVMNGFMREDNLQTISFTDNFVNERNESNNYEIPSKRSRIEIESNMSSDLNTRKETKPKNIIMAAFQYTWDKFKNKTRNGVNNNSQNVSTLPKINVFNGMTSSGSNAIETNATNNERIATNESLSSNMKPISQLTQSFENNTSNRNKKRGLRRLLNLGEKRRYQQLLNRHTPQAIVEKNFVRKVQSPAVIDLTSEKSVVSPNNNTQTSQQLFKTEYLDKDSKVNVINRIKTQGVVAPTLTTNRPLFSTIYNNNNNKLNRFSSLHSTPKFSAFNRKIEETLPKSPDLTSNSVSITSVPESTKKFNNLIETKKDYLNSDFISDLRSSLIKSTESDDRKISKSKSILNEIQNKRQTNCESLSIKLKSPITRTELLPFIPFISFDDKIEEEEEEEEEEDEESSPSDFPVLTADMNREIDSALRPSPPNEVLSDGITGQICRKDMETLKGLNWLNDEIINFYLSLIVERGKNDNYPTVHAFNTFFYTKLKDNGPQSLKRWTRKLDIFSNHFIFIPIHLGMHWCLAVIDFVNKKIEYYDSMGGNNTECIQALKAWLQAESLDKKKCEFPMTDWSLQMAKDIPQQMNGSDCGMFSCKYAEYISRKAKINFSQAHMPYFRRRMVYEILTKQLL